MAGDRSRADVRDTYERIAAHFSKTREYPWPEVQAFVDEHVEGDSVDDEGVTDDGGVALDVGCGNGRHAEALAGAGARVLALDVSAAVLAEAGDRLADSAVRGRVALLLGDAVALPVATGGVDVALSIATVHHLPSREERVASLDELARVLATDGRALVSAWSTAHDRFDAAADADEGFDAAIEWTLPDGEAVDRYYHVYAPSEFRRDVSASRLALEDFEVSSGNCYAVVRPEGKRP